MLTPAPGSSRAPRRRRLPDDRTEVGRKFRVGDYEGYIHVGVFDDGTPGDIFVDIAKEGTTLAGLMNSFMIAVSLGLQYGVPLEVYVSKFAHMRFEPSGPTNDPDIRVAKSIVDYVFRWMGKKFLTVDQQEEIGILSPEVRARMAAAYAAGAPDATGARPSDAGPDGALQHARGRDRVLALRRPDGSGRHVLHVPRLRDEHRLRLSRRRQQPFEREGPEGPSRCIHEVTRWKLADGLPTTVTFPGSAHSFRVRREIVADGAVDRRIHRQMSNRLMDGRAAMQSSIRPSYQSRKTAFHSRGLTGPRRGRRRAARRTARRKRSISGGRSHGPYVWVRPSASFTPTVGPNLQLWWDLAAAFEGAPTQPRCSSSVHSGPRRECSDRWARAHRRRRDRDPDNLGFRAAAACKRQRKDESRPNARGSLWHVATLLPTC